MLFRKDIDPRCAYCARGSRIGEDKVACVKRGIVAPEYHCAAFIYDPLRRVPPKPAVIRGSFTDEDFLLEEEPEK